MIHLNSALSVLAGNVASPPSSHSNSQPSNSRHGHQLHLALDVGKRIALSCKGCYTYLVVQLTKQAMKHKLSRTCAYHKTFALGSDASATSISRFLFQVPFQRHRKVAGLTISAANLDTVTLSAHFADACDVAPLVVQITETKDEA